MDVGKIYALLCGFLLIVCLTLSITCLVVMRNAVEETSAWQGRAEALVNELGGCVQTMKDMGTEEDLPVIAPEGNENDAQNVRDRYCLRLDGDSIGVYDAQGYLIQRSSTHASLLPPQERERLAMGVWLESWAEVGRLLQDLE